MSKHVWKAVEGFEDRYLVSNHGEVYSFVTDRILRPGKTGDGYYTINLCRPGQRQRSHYIHVLVAKAFIPNPMHKPTVNHKDGNRDFNVVDNLEWATYSENHKHAYDHLGRKPPKARCGADNNKSVPVLQHLSDGSVRAFVSFREAGISVNRTGGAVRQAAVKNFRCAGFYWSLV